MQPHTIPEPDGKSTSLPNDDDAQEKTTCPNDFTKDIGQKEEYLVSWADHDPDNPKDWPFKKRWQITAVSSAFTFLGPLSTSMIAPALQVIGRDVEIPASAAFERSLTLSIFVLAFAFGPFLVGPLSEMYGRRWVLQLFNLEYLVFNTACGFAKTGTQLIVFRFLAGIGGSAAGIVGAGILGDLWRPEERGLSISLYTLITLLSPTLGPVLGGFITQYASWRWSFWSTSIAGAVIQVVGLVLLRETFPPLLLGRRAKHLRLQTGNESLHTKWETPNRTFGRIALASVARPFILLGTQPIAQVLTLYIAYLFGLVYLALATFPELWTTEYNQSISISGLNYLSIAVGYIIGTQSCAKLIDLAYERLKTRNGGVGIPEYRLPVLIPGSLLVPVGLVWYGWSAQHHLHWIMPNIGAAIFAAGVKFGLQCTQVYALDVYPTYAASASAASSSMRSLAGFAFPIFAPYMYDRMGYGWGNSVLAFIALVLGLPAAVGLWIYGPSLRKRSKFAAGD